MTGSNVKMMGTGVAAAALFVVGLVTWIRSPDPASALAQVRQTPEEMAPPQDAMLEFRTKGVDNAPVTIFELSDFQCPYCRRFWEETLPALEEEYIDTGKARFIFINLPLVSLHPNAPAAHEFAMCAAKQERFWPVHDLLYDHQDVWSNLSDPSPFFYGFVDSAGLDRARLEQCLSGGETRGVILSDIQQAQRGSITQTPTFVVEGGLLPGAQPIEVWRPILDSIIAAKETN